MIIPKRRRVNTIGVKYVKGVIKDEHYEQIIETILGLRDEDILKIHESASTRFLFQLNKVNYDYVCKHHVCKFLTLDEDSIIMIEDISSYKTEVYISGIRFDISEEEVLNILGNYGIVKNHYYRGKNNVKYFLRRGTERMTVIMELHRSIPTALYIKDTLSNILVSYAGQPITCHRCGDLYHKYKRCPNPIGTGINAFELDPVQTDENETDPESEENDERPKEGEKTEEPRKTDEQGVPEQKPELETPQPEETTPLPDPSPAPETPIANKETQAETETKVSNMLKNFPECKSTPTQGEELKVHVPIHTGDKPFSGPTEPPKGKTDKNNILTGGKPLSSPKTNTITNEKPSQNIQTHTEEGICTECNMIFENHDDYSQHARAHLGIVPFKCSECTYKANKIQDLTNHMIEKNHMTEKIPGMKTRSTFADKVKNSLNTRRK